MVRFTDLVGSVKARVSFARQAECQARKVGCLGTLNSTVKWKCEVANVVKGVSFRCTFKGHTQECNEQGKCGTLYMDVHPEFRALCDTQFIAKSNSHNQVTSA